jgi:DNA-binding LacI/PurR family transcriptional regulator
MYDVAARAGVSHQTVSRVLNGSLTVRDTTRGRVLEAIAELGYRRNNAARALVTNRSGRLGMIANHLPLYGPNMIAHAVQDAGLRYGYEVALIALEGFGAASLHAAVDRLLDQAVEAIVVAAAQGEALAVVTALELPVPVVVAQGVAAGQPMAAGIDQEQGGRRAAQHLIGLGCRVVAHVTGPTGWGEADQRRAGWLRAHEDLGLAPGPEIPGDWSTASGYAAGCRLARDQSVDAVFAGNDAMALGVLRALHEHGRRVPDEICVVGFDDVPEAEYFWPSLTTVRQDFGELGRRAVDLLLRALDGEHNPFVDLMAPELVVRSSSRRSGC